MTSDSKQQRTLSNRKAVLMVIYVQPGETSDEEIVIICRISQYPAEEYWNEAIRMGDTDKLSTSVSDVLRVISWPVVCLYAVQFDIALTSRPCLPKHLGPGNMPKVSLSLRKYHIFA